MYCVAHVAVCASGSPGAKPQTFLPARKKVHKPASGFVPYLQVLVGGKLTTDKAGGQFYAPTVLVGVKPSMRIWKEEVFGPVMVIVECGSDEEAVSMANDCPFGLGSAVFSRSPARARSIGTRLEVHCQQSSYFFFKQVGISSVTLPSA